MHVLAVSSVKADLDPQYRILPELGEKTIKFQPLQVEGIPDISPEVAWAETVVVQITEIVNHPKRDLLEISVVGRDCWERHRSPSGTDVTRECQGFKFSCLREVENV